MARRSLKKNLDMFLVVFCPSESAFTLGGA